MITGILFPHETLFTGWFGVLTAFVAVNTLMYVTLAILKVFPRFYPSDWLRRTNTRSETRHIHPDAPVGGPRPRGGRGRDGGDRGGRGGRGQAG